MPDANMLTGTSNYPPESIKVKREEKASFSKRLRGNVSMANSCKEEINYRGGASVAVPFTWESRPGTPKIKFCERPLPPLTPPPSYFYSSPKRTAKKPASKHNLLDTIFFNIRATRKVNLPESPVILSSSSSSSSHSSQSSTTPRTASHSVLSTPKTVSSMNGESRPRKSLESRLNVEDREEHDCESPVSTLCFGIGRGANARTGSSCYASISKGEMDKSIDSPNRWISEA